MSKANISRDHLSKKHDNDSDDWDAQINDEHYDPDAPAKNDRTIRKRNAEARRRYENLRDDLRLQAMLDEDVWH